MSQIKKYPYQTTVKIPDHDGEWIDHVSESDGMTKAQVLRSVIGAGLEIIEAVDNPEVLLTEETYQRSVVRYGYRSVPILSEEMGARIEDVSARQGIDRAIVIRAAITLGRPVVERRRKAARGIAA